MSAAGKPDAVSALLGAAEALRAAARGLERVDLADAEARADLRALLGDIRRCAFAAVALGALELTPVGLGPEYLTRSKPADADLAVLVKRRRERV